MLPRFQRLVDRVDAGEAVAWSELDELAPLFIGYAPQTRAPSGDSPAVAQAPVLQLRPGSGAPTDASVVCARWDLAASLARLATRPPEPRPEAIQVVPDWGNATGQELASALRAPWYLAISRATTLTDLVAPYVREVTGSLDAFGLQSGHAVAMDDDRYALLPLLFARHPQLVAERDRNEVGRGVARDPGGLVVITPRALDLRRADVRVRNALTALRRRDATVVAIPPDPWAIKMLRAYAPAPPAGVIVLTAGAVAGERVLGPRAVHTTTGRRLALRDVAGHAVVAALPRVVSFEQVDRVLVAGARALMQPEVVRSAGQGFAAVGDDVFNCLLTLLDARLGDDADGWSAELACLVHPDGSAVELCLAVWRSWAWQR